MPNWITHFRKKIRRIFTSAIFKLPKRSTFGWPPPPPPHSSSSIWTCAMLQRASGVNFSNGCINPCNWMWYCTVSRSWQKGLSNYLSAKVPSKKFQRIVTSGQTYFVRMKKLFLRENICPDIKNNHTPMPSKFTAYKGYLMQQPRKKCKHAKSLETELQKVTVSSTFDAAAGCSTEFAPTITEQPPSLPQL